MKFLILVEIASLGGHALSALTTGRELERLGHKVQFAGGDGPLEAEIRKEFTFYPLKYYYRYKERETYFSWKSLKTLRALRELVKKKNFDHIHAFDARSYILATMLSMQKKIPVTCTLCGGVTPYYNVPQTGKIIVFSREQKRKLVGKYRWDENNIEVISARLDMTQFSTASKKEATRLCASYRIFPEHRNIFMISNFLGPKVEAIKHVLSAAAEVAQEFEDVRFVFVGARGEYFEKAKEIGQKINSKCDREVLIFTGAVMNAHRFLLCSYAVLGVGRSAFEGMAYRKPTLIIGEKGYAGTVNEENICEIYYFNFSGRNNRQLVPAEDFADELKRLLKEKEYYESVRHFGVEFLKKNIDIKSGINRIENVYKVNMAYMSQASRISRRCNMVRTLIPIIIDNYYNAFKQRLFRLKRGLYSGS